MGSISSAALIYLFSDSESSNGRPHSLTLYGVLAAIIFSEHVYFATSYVVRLAMAKLESPGLLQERRERFIIRRRYLQESLGVDEETEYARLDEKASFGRASGETGVEGRFWGKQKGLRGSLEAGREIIRGSFEKKDQ